MRATLAILDKKGPNAEQVLMTTLSSLVEKESEVAKTMAPKHPMEQKMQKWQSGIPVLSTALGGVCSSNEPTIFEIGQGAVAFQGRIYPSLSNRSPFSTIAEESSWGREKAIENLMKNFEGDFAVVIAEPERIVAGRDSIGVQPLYYGENSAHAAIGTNRSVLWKLGISEPRSFPPGHLGVITKDGLQFKPIKTLIFSEPKQPTIDAAADDLIKMIERAVRIRVEDAKELAVAFSGGLDSSVIAFLAKKLSIGVHLVHVSLEGQREIEEAKLAASALNLPLSIHLFREKDVTNIVPKVVELIEEPDPIKTSIGIPIYWVAQKTSEAGLKILFAGQGADELFGGYHRYSEEYRLRGEKETRKIMFNDIARIHESNLERDQKICNFHDVELRLPFVSYALAEFATSLPIELKIEQRTDSRKLVLRRAAEKMGLPAHIARKPKKALQYSTGVSSALEKLARKQKTTTGGYMRQVFNELKPVVPDL